MLLPKYIIGLDLGQQNDYTVISVVVLHKDNKQVVHLYRFPLKTSYVSIVKHISMLVLRAPILDDYLIVADYTGVGRSVFDLFYDYDVSVIGVNITGGNKHRWDTPRTVNVPKVELVSSLQIGLQNGTIQLSSKIPIINYFIEEMVNFKATLSTKRVGLDARSGYHDDIVMSLSLAIWYIDYRLKKGKNTQILSGN